MPSPTPGLRPRTFGRSCRLASRPSGSSGVARLATMAPPRSYPAHAWQQLITDAERFLDDWAQQAAALGWPAWELFGCHRRAPWGRIQGMGLVLLLHGDPLAALTASEAVIRRPSGAHQTWRRKPADPLHRRRALPRLGALVMAARRRPWSAPRSAPAGCSSSAAARSWWRRPGMSRTLAAGRAEGAGRQCARRL